MPQFGPTSRKRLLTCSPGLQLVMNTAIKSGPDFTVLEGHRPTAKQLEYYAKGRTTPGPIVTHVDGVNRMSEHNYSPSRAADIAPWPIDWDDVSRFMVLGGYILAVANILKVPLRWGADWNRNYDTSDERFVDLPHFEQIGGT